MKASGAQIKDFYDNHWPSGYYFEEEDAEVKLNDNDSGEWLLDHTERYDTAKFGYLVKEGETVRGVPDTISFTTAFGKWLKTSLNKTLIVTVPTGYEQAVAAHLEEYFKASKIAGKVKL